MLKVTKMVKKLVKLLNIRSLRHPFTVRTKMESQIIHNYLRQLLHSWLNYRLLDLPV